MNDNESELRQQVLRRLKGVGAHTPFEEAFKDFPVARINDKFPNGEYSAWGLLEHLRLGQWDMLDYIKNRDYREISWPKDYWPDPSSRANPEQWQASVESFLGDRAELEGMVQNRSVDLFSTVPSSKEHTILREMLQVAAHNAFHIGEFAILRQVMGTWGDR